MTAPQNPRKYPQRTPIGHKVSAALRAKGLKRCPMCKKTKPLADFNRRKASLGNVGSYCRACMGIRSARNRAAGRQSEDASAMARFLEKRHVIRSGCWLWRGAMDSQGHGCFTYKGNTILAHVAACHLFGKAIPQGKITRITCGVPCCCNPDHVDFCTRQEMSLLYARDNPFRRNAQKAQCLRGHAFTKENTFYFRADSRHPTRVCLTCLRLRNPGTRKRPNKPSDAVTAKAGKLMHKMEAHVARLPLEIREDARSILLVEILAGAVDDLTEAVKRAAREAWKYQPSRWAVPLDAPIADDSDMSLVDLLPDPSALSDPAMAHEMMEGE